MFFATARHVCGPANQLVMRRVLSDKILTTGCPYYVLINISYYKSTLKPPTVSPATSCALALGLLIALFMCRNATGSRSCSISQYAIVVCIMIATVLNIIFSALSSSAGVLALSGPVQDTATPDSLHQRLEQKTIQLLAFRIESSRRIHNGKCQVCGGCREVLAAFSVTYGVIHYVSVTKTKSRGKIEKLLTKIV